MKRTFDEQLVARVEASYEEVSANLTILRNTIASTSASNLPDIRARVALVIDSLNRAAYEMQKIITDYGGTRDH